MFLNDEEENDLKMLVLLADQALNYLNDLQDSLLEQIAFSGDVCTRGALIGQRNELEGFIKQFETGKDKVDFSG